MSAAFFDKTDVTPKMIFFCYFFLLLVYQRLWQMNDDMKEWKTQKINLSNWYFPYVFFRSFHLHKVKHGDLGTGFHFSFFRSIILKWFLDIIFLQSLSEINAIMGDGTLVVDGERFAFGRAGADQLKGGFLKWASRVEGRDLELHWRNDLFIIFNGSDAFKSPQNITLQ